MILGENHKNICNKSYNSFYHGMFTNAKYPLIHKHTHIYIVRNQFI